MKLISRVLDDMKNECEINRFETVKIVHCSPVVIGSFLLSVICCN